MNSSDKESREGRGSQRLYNVNVHWVANEKTSCTHPRSADRQEFITVWASITRLKVQVERRLPCLLLQHPNQKIPDGEAVWLEHWFSRGVWDIASDSPPKSKGARWNGAAWGTCSLVLLILWISLHKVSPEEKRIQFHSWKPLAQACGAAPHVYPQANEMKWFNAGESNLKSVMQWAQLNDF